MQHTHSHPLSLAPNLCPRKMVYSELGWGFPPMISSNDVLPFHGIHEPHWWNCQFYILLTMSHKLRHSRGTIIKYDVCPAVNIIPTSKCGTKKFFMASICFANYILGSLTFISKLSFCVFLHRHIFFWLKPKPSTELQFFIMRELRVARQGRFRCCSSWLWERTAW
jgi:hypothetical protein